MFLKFALGKREEKSELEIKSEMTQRSYNPLSDPLMPRLFRKVSHQNSQSRTFQTMGSSSQNAHYSGVFSSKDVANVSIYDNNTSQMGRERYSLVQIPLRTKVTTGRPYQQGKSPSMSMMHTQGDDSTDRYKDTLREMKQMLMDKVKDGNKKADTKMQYQQNSTGKKGTYLPAIANEKN